MLAPNNSNNQNIGDGLQVNAGRDAEVHYHEPPKPKSSAIQELLFNIIDIEKKESASLKDDDYRTYSIEDKIKFGETDNFDGYRDEMLELLNDYYAYDLVLENLPNGGLEEVE